jgi:hypothetical protein
LRFALRKIDFNQDQVVIRELIELRMREHFALKPHTPTAPVRTGEVEKDGFIFAARAKISGRGIGQPRGAA